MSGGSRGPVYPLQFPIEHQGGVNSLHSLGIKDDEVRRHLTRAADPRNILVDLLEPQVVFAVEAVSPLDV